MMPWARLITRPARPATRPRAGAAARSRSVRRARSVRSRTQRAHHEGRRAAATTSCSRTSALKSRVKPGGPPHAPGAPSRRPRCRSRSREPTEAVVPEDEVEDAVVLGPPDIGAIGRRRQGHGSDPPARRDDHGDAHQHDLPHPTPPSGRRGEQVDDGQDGKDQEGLHHLGDEAEPDEGTRQHQPLRLRPLERLASWHRSPP